MSIPSGDWLQERDALRRYQIGRRTLREWARDGLVATVRLGQSSSSRRVFATADLDRALRALARGREPTPRTAARP